VFIRVLLLTATHLPADVSSAGLRRGCTNRAFR
jgi:hypothetical protein